ncbi:MAG TPA: alpha/beta hydrolase [Spirochaetota bacterium]|nr:alpha/beta hydrolase [Spirochaetota bacterium]HPS87058.1 alpha/beta hydrolase [Spirochaetota bacterium]
MSSYKNKNNKIYYNIYKSKSAGNNLLLIHDNGQSSKIFDPEIKFYSSYFNTMTVDLSGHGKSPAGNDTVNNFWISNAIAISELCEKEKFKKTSIIGLGGGALVALNMAIINPSLVKNIIAESIPGIEPDIDYLNSILAYRDHLKNSDAKSLFQSMNGSRWEKVLEEDSMMHADFIENGDRYLHGDPALINCPVLLAGSSGYDILPDMEDRLKGAVASFKKAQVHLFSSAKYPLIISKNHEYRTVTLNYLMDGL